MKCTTVDFRVYNDFYNKNINKENFDDFDLEKIIDIIKYYNTLVKVKRHLKRNRFGGDLTLEYFELTEGEKTSIGIYLNKKLKIFKFKLDKRLFELIDENPEISDELDKSGLYSKLDQFVSRKLLEQEIYYTEFEDCVLELCKIHIYKEFPYVNSLNKGDLKRLITKSIKKKKRILYYNNLSTESKKLFRDRKNLSFNVWKIKNEDRYKEQQKEIKKNWIIKKRENDPEYYKNYAKRTLEATRKFREKIKQEDKYKYTETNRVYKRRSELQRKLGRKLTDDELNKIKKEEELVTEKIKEKDNSPEELYKQTLSPEELKIYRKKKRAEYKKAWVSKQIEERGEEFLIQKRQASTDSKKKKKLKLTSI